MIMAHQLEVNVAPNCSTTEPRSRDDRATIAHRSGHDRASIVVHDLSPSSRPMKIARPLTIVRSMKIGRSIFIHVSACESSLMMVNPNR